MIVETGVAHGGSLVFYASLFEAMGHGRVIGMDIDIRSHNRTAIEAHPLAPRITLIEGSSTAPDVLAAVHAHRPPAKPCWSILDCKSQPRACRGRTDLYAPLVSPGSYIVACDGIMASLAGAPRTAPDWTWNNPMPPWRISSLRNPDFVLEEPRLPVQRRQVRNRVTYWPKCFLKRR